MEVLASRVLLRPTDLDRSRAFYRDTLKLPIFREFDTPGGTGTVFFIGGGYLEVSGHADAPPAEGSRSGSRSATSRRRAVSSTASGS